MKYELFMRNAKIKKRHALLELSFKGTEKQFLAKNVKIGPQNFPSMKKKVKGAIFLEKKWLRSDVPSQRKRGRIFFNKGWKTCLVQNGKKRYIYIYKTSLSVSKTRSNKTKYHWKHNCKHFYDISNGAKLSQCRESKVPWYIKYTEEEHVASVCSPHKNVN